MAKFNKTKVNEKANQVLNGLTGLRDTLKLILLGAGIQEAATNVIEQKFNSVSEQFNDFFNLLHQEIEAYDRYITNHDASLHTPRTAAGLSINS